MSDAPPHNSIYKTDKLIASDIDAYLNVHQHKLGTSITPKMSSVLILQHCSSARVELSMGIPNYFQIT